MKCSVSLPIDGTKEDIWSVITDIEHSDQNISGIDKIEVLEKPDELTGFKWRETRTMFGKEATEVMWITEAEENHYYKTRAESHGMVYISTMSIEEEGDHQVLTMGFEGEPQTFSGKFMNFIFGKMMRSSMEKTIMKDLEDIREVVTHKH
tara:strand:+ start:321 stop:770 length:450 start_codon:yes stop_codon:yes gene_type:complete